MQALWTLAPTSDGTHWPTGSAVPPAQQHAARHSRVRLHVLVGEYCGMHNPRGHPVAVGSALLPPQQKDPDSQSPSSLQTWQFPEPLGPVAPSAPVAPVGPAGPVAPVGPTFAALALGRSVRTTPSSKTITKPVRARWLVSTEDSFRRLTTAINFPLYSSRTTGGARSTTDERSRWPTPS